MWNYTTEEGLNGEFDPKSGNPNFVSEHFVGLYITKTVNQFMKNFLDWVAFVKGEHPGEHVVANYYRHKASIAGAHSPTPHCLVNALGLMFKDLSEIVDRDHLVRKLMEFGSLYRCGFDLYERNKELIKNFLVGYEKSQNRLRWPKKTRSQKEVVSPLIRYLSKLDSETDKKLNTLIQIGSCFFYESNLCEDIIRYKDINKIAAITNQDDYESYSKECIDASATHLIDKILRTSVKEDYKDKYGNMPNTEVLLDFLLKACLGKNTRHKYHLMVFVVLMIVRSDFMDVRWQARPVFLYLAVDQNGLPVSFTVGHLLRKNVEPVQYPFYKELNLHFGNPLLVPSKSISNCSWAPGERDRWLQIYYAALATLHQVSLNCVDIFKKGGPEQFFADIFAESDGDDDYIDRTKLSRLLYSIMQANKILAVEQVSKAIGSYVCVTST